MERWLEINEFPGYSVGDQGHVRNDYTGRILSMVRNQGGSYFVGLTKDGRQYKRGVSKLVADRFLPHNTNDAFDTPMHLDGDRANCAADNLVWRPRWYSNKYLRHFEDREYRKPYYDAPIVEAKSGREFANSFEAAVYYGLLEYAVYRSVIEGEPARPTFHNFYRLEGERIDPYGENQE